MTAPTIDALPPSPNPLDPRTFAPTGVVFAQALPTFRAQLNALGEYINVTIAPLAGSVAAAGASAEAAAISAGEALAQANLAATFAEAAQVAAGVYDTIAEGRAAVADGEYFKVIAEGSDELEALTLYRRDTGSTQTLIMEFADADVAAAAVGSADAAAASAGAASASAIESVAARDLAQNYAAALTGTSATEIEIGTGTRNLTIEPNKQFAPGQWVVIARTADVSDYMIGQVSSYTAGTGALVVDVTVIGGSGTYSGWTIALSAKPSEVVSTISIFSPQAASAEPASGGVSVLRSVFTDLGFNVKLNTSISYAQGFFVASDLTARNVVYSSADGEVWMARTMPSSATWYITTNGTTFFAVANGGTATAVSDDGITWTAATALPAAAKAHPAFVGNRVLVLSNASTTTAYYSDDYGATWNTATLPTASGAFLVSVSDSIFAYYTSGAGYQTSTTGETGSWTARTVPTDGEFDEVTQNPDGSLVLIKPSDGSNGFAILYRTTDGIDWVSADVSSLKPPTLRRGYYNGVYFCGSAPEHFSTHHGANGVETFRGSTAVTAPSWNFGAHAYRWASNGTVGVIPSETAEVLALIDMAAVGLFYL